MDITTKDKKNNLYLNVIEDPWGNGTVFTFTRAFKLEAWYMVVHLPAYLAFLYRDVAFEYFNSEAANWTCKAPWENEKKCILSAINRELDSLLQNNDYGWNIKLTEIKGTAKIIQEAMRLRQKTLTNV